MKLHETTIRAGRAAALLLALAGLLLPAPAATAQGARERLMPERYLREYDPVTLFLAEPRGPRGGGPGDDASAVLAISPRHPGEYRWLDASTLQFLPAEPWPALRTFTFRTPAGRHERNTLMAPPSSVSPAPGAVNLGAFDALTLTFPTPLDPETLAEMVELEIRSLPGLGSQEPTRLARRDFAVKELDRADRRSPAQYRISLASPAGDGKSVSLRLRLSLDAGIPGAAASYSWSTRTDFRVLAFGTGGTSWPVSASGSVYPADMAVSTGTGNAPLVVDFSEAIAGDNGLALLRSMVSFEPAVRNLRLETQASRLLLYFERDADTDYTFTLKPAPLRSASGRLLSPFAASSFHFYARALAPYVRWKAGQAILEKDGPRNLPMEARGVDRIDLRLYRVDPLDPDFFPFPAEPLKVEEKTAPPMPGEEPPAGVELVKQIRLLGSPDFSGVVTLPTRPQGGAAGFGLDLAPLLKGLGAEGQPGTWLAGYRPLGAEGARYYVRVQVTDLSLTLVEENRALVFAVTSLRTGKPVEGATVSLDARDADKDGSVRFRSLVQGRTDREGRFRYEHSKPLDAAVRRVAVSFQGDSLVLDPDQAPPYFHENHWFGPQARWLSWLTMPPWTTDLAARELAYVYTERPIYRSEEPVHIQGFVRVREKGLIKAPAAGDKRTLVIRSPDGKEFRYPAELKGNGYFYRLFDEKDLPTGVYEVALLGPKDEQLASMSFRKEQYRIPTVELNLNGPDRVAFDAPFSVELAATYYAGGKVAGQSVEWTVAEGAWSLAPAAWPGYRFSTYLSVGGEYLEEGISSSESEDLTDDEGLARITIDPRAAESIKARWYRVQATLRGADEQSVSQSRTVYALPPFSIGLKLPRFETERMAVRPSIVVLDHAEKVLAGKELTLRLYERQWHSYLAESDLSTGAAKYVSDVVDVPVLERKLLSLAGSLDLELPVTAAGVYIVELQGRDAVGRLQSIKGDLYVAGPTPVAWKRETAAVFETALGKESHEPGDTARILLKSPFQEASALAVVERPSGNLYRWVEVRDGQGMLEVPVTEELVPRFPVHFVLMRGRLPGSPSFQGGQDRLRPLSVANTTWITVDPSSNRLGVVLEHEPKGLPGSPFKVKVLVKDRAGKPVDGEVSLWLVDRAVLSLAKERFASPLSSFITPVEAAVRVSDTRNLAVGNLPFEELMGGDFAEESAFGSLLDKTSVRKNFKTVPYFNPALKVVGGVAEVTIAMPDNLTEFALRAIATSGYDRFGVARSQVAMRLPVIAQESLPRFIRPGDSVVAGGVGRVVEGPGGPAAAELELGGGLLLEGGADKERRNFVLDSLLPAKLTWPLKAPLSLAREADRTVSVTLGVARLSDMARDAFSLSIPVRRDTVTRRVEVSVTPETGREYGFTVPREAIRPGSGVQTAWLVSSPELLKVLRALRFQAAYPYGCTEQRIAKAHAPIALSAAFGAAGIPEEFRVPEPYLASLFSYLQSAISPSGLYSFYPGSSGHVGLTAYVVEFLVLARSAGYAVPAVLLARPVDALREALRSDYGGFSEGWSLLERSLALCALDAAGSWDASYGQELLAAAMDADLYAQARIWLVLQGKKGVNASLLKRLRDRIGEQLVFQKTAAGLSLAGFQQKRSWFGNPFLHADARSGAAAYAVYAKDRPGSPETQALLAWLLDQAGQEGWGDTYTNSLVLATLAETLKALPRKGAVAEVWDGSAWKTLDGRGAAIVRLAVASDQSLKARIKSFDARNPPALLLETAWTPAAPGSQLAGASNGFAVTRELLDYGSGKALVARYPAQAGKTVSFAQGSVVEDHVRVVNPEQRAYAALRVPLAAGFEPMNPSLATSPAEAKPAGRNGIEAAWVDYQDDQVTFYFEELPAGSFDFYFRTRATFAGSYSLPPATAQVLYDLKVQGTSDGVPVRVTESP